MRDGAATNDAWIERNQRYLVAQLALLSRLLEPEVGEGAADAPLDPGEPAGEVSAPPALEVLAAAFGLSPFERDLVLLCAGVELDAAFAARCVRAQGDPRRVQPTFSLALAILPDAHWSALGPGAPLRRFHLIEVGPGDTLTRSPLRIDERVLHFLVGVEHPDERLAGILEPARPAAALVPSHRRIAERIVAQWTGAAERGAALIEIHGGDPRMRRDVAAAACAALGMRLRVLAAAELAARPDAERLGRLLAREQIISGGAVLIDVEDLEGLDAHRLGALRRLLERLPGLVLVSARERVRLTQDVEVALEIARPTPDEQRAIWRAALAAARGVGSAPGGADALVEPLVAHFDLEAAGIRRACAAAPASAAWEVDPAAALWEACRAELRPELAALAQRLDPVATWDDLVLPGAAAQALREITASVRQRAKVHGAWRFAERGARGLGVGALFAGPSGTGKTLAAEVLARELRLDLYRIDLSQLVSKYIGETEKNLRRVFDAAERGTAILLFDEADALFGRRGEVRDGVDRYANLEVAYLLQRMEAYRGLVILTTNLERAIDPAFLRRLRFVVRFPLPGAAERAAMWRRAFPAEAPTEGLEVERLAELSLTGGSIRNVALRAAFLAAEAGAPVRMEHVLAAAQGEWEKLGRTGASGQA